MATVFLRLLAHDDKAAGLANALDRLRGSRVCPDGRIVDPVSFPKVPGAPFAYWVSEKVRKMFKSLPPFENEDRTVRVGLQTSDDFRFVRCWWEVSPHCTLGRLKWPELAGRPAEIPAMVPTTNLRGQAMGTFRQKEANLSLVLRRLSSCSELGTRWGRV